MAWGSALVPISAGHWAPGTRVWPAGRGVWVTADCPWGSAAADPEIFYLLLQVEKALTYEKFVAWTKPDAMDEEEVEVFLPRFTLEESYDMEEFLRELGMTDAFEEARADFRGMSSWRGLHLSKVIHKSLVEVTEEGTEAVAATGEDVMTGSLTTIPMFYADHPFLFFIQHSRTGAILFCGRFCSP